MKHKNITRRNFCKYSLSGLGTLTLGQLPIPAYAATNDDHFFLQVIFTSGGAGGADPVYMFDSRPLEMTKEKVLSNYLKTEPYQWIGSNGQRCLASELTRELLPLKNDFSIINGVLMATDFDGHDQNTNYMLTGNPFGGESFIPKLNTLSQYKKTSIDGTYGGGLLLATLSNHGSMIPMGGEQGQKLVDNLNIAEAPSLNKPHMQQALKRIQANSTGEGRFSIANKIFGNSLNRTEELYNKFQNLDFQTSEDPDEQFIDLIGKLYKNRVGRTALLNIDLLFNPTEAFILDTHALRDAQRQPEMYKLIIGRIKKIMKTLKNTQYDETRSLLDVTTVLIGSEFGRTMRQTGLPIDATGTDHNPLSNSYIIAGKGIKGGMVLGQSDYQRHDEQLSSVHLNMDPEKKKFMGKRFDFTTQKTINTLPGAFDANEFISMANITNSIFSLFGVDKEHYWKPSRFGDMAPVLSSLLK